MNATLWVIVALAGIGVLNTIYLSYHAITKTPVKCIFFPDEWCHKVQMSSYSRMFGIPNAFMGFAMYAGILVFSLLYASDVTPFWPVTVLILMGFLFSMYFSYIQASVLKAWCTWCVLSAIDFTLLVIALILLAAI